MKKSMLLIAVCAVLHAKSEYTNEPTPKGPFISMPVQIQDKGLTESHGLYRKWTYNVALKEERGVGVTFNLFEFWFDSPIQKHYWKKKVHVRVEPNQVKLVKAFDWVNGGTKHTAADLHYKRRSIYYGVDDKGNAVKAEYTTEE